MAVAIEQDGRELAHVRLVAHTEEPSTAWISLQECEHGSNGTMASQDVRFFDRFGKLQRLRHNLGGLPCAQDRTAEQGIQRLEDGEKCPHHTALRLTARLSKRSLAVIMIAVARLSLSMPHKKQLHMPSV
jgi:hypothetical protein